MAGVVVVLTAMLAYWNENTFRLGYENVWPTIAFGAVTAVVVTLMLRLVCKTWARAGIAAGLVAIYFFYVPVIPGLDRLPFVLGAVVHVAAIVTLAALFWLLPADEERFKNIAGRLNALCIIVLSVSGVPFVISQVQLEERRASARGTLGSLEGHADSDSPDVWHILFDRYAAAQTLRQKYDFDNEPFIEALRQRGFTVADEAYSNYQRTGHSVASTMNGTLLDGMAHAMRDSQEDWIPIYRGMKNGSALRLFNKMGYETIFAGSWWEPSRASDVASRSITIRSTPEFGRLLIDRSATGFWLRSFDIPYLNSRADQCFRANEKFRVLREISRQPGRKMIFAHFLVPHPPFVLNPDGSCRSSEAARKASRKDNYVGQVRFVNREVLSLIDAILAGPRPAYIVVHSDEGPWPAPYIGNEHGLGTDAIEVPWTKLTDDQLREKMAILLAVRDPSGLPPATMPLSPVQIYPALLRDHFGSTKRLPSSRHYIYRSDAALYEFDDVSGRLRANMNWPARAFARDRELHR